LVLKITCSGKTAFLALQKIHPLALDLALT